MNKPSGIEISFYKSAGREAARYVSGPTVREEALEHTRMIGLYWSGVGQVQRENVTSGLPGIDCLEKPIHVFELEIDGQDLRNRWDWISSYERPGVRFGVVEAVVELKHQVRDIGLKIVTALDGSPILTRYLEITNTGSSPAALSHVSPWSGLLWSLDPAWNPPSDIENEFEIGYLRAEGWGQEGEFVWQPVRHDNFRIERTKLRSHGSPYFVVRNNVTGEMFFAAFAWSGNWFADFSHRFQNSLFFKIGTLSPAPQRIIASGETIISPAVHIGLFHGDMDDAVHAWHEHVRTSVILPRPKGKEMYTVAARVVEEPDDWILKEIDITAEMGVEAYMVDAGWYGDEFNEWTKQRGDWYEGDWLPGGLKGIRDHARNKGLIFGLWMEPESLSPESNLFKDHPDWPLKTDEDRVIGWPALNLAIPEVSEFVEKSVIDTIRKYELDFFKIDYNVTMLEGGQNIRDGFAENEAWRHFEEIYRIFGRMHKEFPDTVFENCAGGGGRNDLGMLRCFHYACESDWSAFPFSIRTINAMTLFLPPEAICYYHNHLSHAHLTADADTHLRATLFATPIFVGFGAQDADRSTSYFDKTRRYIEMAKTFCRPIMANRPVVYHHTPDIGVFGKADWCVLEYGSQDRSRAYAGIFKLAPGTSEFLFKARGIDISGEYNVTLDNSGQTFSASGRELVISGIPVRLDSALTSELLLISKL